MTRYEKQKKTYQNIQSIEVELAGCPHGSPQWFELHDRLHALLAEYVSVPQDPPPAHAKHSRQGFRQASYEFRSLIWLVAIGLLVTLPMALSLGRDLPWMPPFWCAITGVGLAWAIWATCPQRQ